MIHSKEHRLWLTKGADLSKLMAHLIKKQKMLGLNLVGAMGSAPKGI